MTHRVLGDEDTRSYRSCCGDVGDFYKVPALLTTLSESKESADTNHRDADQEIRNEKQNFPAKLVNDERRSEGSNNLNNPDQYRAQAGVYICTGTLVR